MQEPLSIGQLPAPARGQPDSTLPQATTAEPPIPEFGGKIGKISKWFIWRNGTFFSKNVLYWKIGRSTLSL